jgi:hypothetical protein
MQTYGPAHFQIFFFLYLFEDSVTNALIILHYTTSRKVADSNPDEAIGFFN